MLLIYIVIFMSLKSSHEFNLVYIVKISEKRVRFDIVFVLVFQRPSFSHSSVDFNNIKRVDACFSFVFFFPVLLTEICLSFLNFFFHSF